MQIASPPNARYLDPGHIIISAKTSVAPTAEEMEWGRRFFGSSPAPEQGAPRARACAIQREASRTLRCLIPSPRTISQIVADSALGLTGWDEFFVTRMRTQRWPYTLFFNPRRMTGSPFIVELETGTGRTGMVNVTSEIWGRDFAWCNSKVSRDEWLDFVGAFEGRGTGDFRFPLDQGTRVMLRAMSAKWF